MCYSVLKIILNLNYQIQCILKLLQKNKNNLIIHNFKRHHYIIIIINYVYLPPTGVLGLLAVGRFRGAIVVCTGKPNV